MHDPYGSRGGSNAAPQQGLTTFIGEVIGIAEDIDAASARPFALDRLDEGASALHFREPVAQDGPAVTALIARCAPLDTNSAYCNLLQCSHFAATCVVAERDGQLCGWISAYRVPDRPDRLFVWQVAVDASARGIGLGGRMLDALIARPAARGAQTVITTITEDNAASWRLFESLARRHGATLSRTPLFEREAHFAGAHDTEFQAEIGPLASVTHPKELP